MEVLNARSALLSNHEVLSLLRELDSAHIARAKTAVRIKQEEAAAPAGTRPAVAVDEVCENLRTVEVEAISYLAASYLPTPAQTDASVTELTKALAPYALTKAEKLQVVNLAPTEAVELYVIVEELEDRLGEHMEAILEVVRVSLGEPPAADVRTHTFVAEQMYVDEEQVEENWEPQHADGNGNGEFFDDTGEGRGVEGDLDMEDD
ncbi:hypothetical protein FIBSPDRAFT_912893 [Athelia psychrophila]|uniref:DNA-directed RNA polymerase III subunit RPC9 n=1 Tax=Athelia psychrophila TaxID=1759441 RepID=A0A166BCW4_9AGAM|nr:hypothetical protein FIBSPDRAFT_913308 [Fibularhizoctonia sp. CBS 109695]KZP13903.1 hypothetical protein FIBSPDRAFT_912893 [Fibularhizoctonia sp. CBS 109695]